MGHRSRRGPNHGCRTAKTLQLATGRKTSVKINNCQPWAASGLRPGQRTLEVIARLSLSHRYCEGHGQVLHSGRNFFKFAQGGRRIQDRMPASLPTSKLGAADRYLYILARSSLDEAGLIINSRRSRLA